MIQDIYNKQFKIKNLKIIRKNPFNKLAIEFLSEFSQNLKLYKNIHVHNLMRISIICTYDYMNTYTFIHIYISYNIYI